MWYRLASLMALVVAIDGAGCQSGSSVALTRDQLIAFSVLPLPEQLRAGAGVVTFDSAQRVIELRKSSNGMVCVRLHEDTWDARCYHESFAPVVFRAQALAAREPNDAQRRMDEDIKELGLPDERDLMPAQQPS